AVDPDHRGHGIATLLLERLFELTADDARRGYTLEVRVTNSVAIALYERLGFEARGVRRGYYTDNREDALIMWKDPVAGEHRDREGYGGHNLAGQACLRASGLTALSGECRTRMEHG